MNKGRQAVIVGQATNANKILEGTIKLEDAYEVAKDESKPKAASASNSTGNANEASNSGSSREITSDQSAAATSQEVPWGPHGNKVQDQASGLKNLRLKQDKKRKGGKGVGLGGLFVKSACSVL